ncbi:hypothetical protein Syn7502_01251 [Synechococcus sp. PCC 7502]|nr:hypothetical protein Syn7502_01251 [Synechococcus sp. PCC 7502]
METMPLNFGVLHSDEGLNSTVATFSKPIFEGRFF